MIYNNLGLIINNWGLWEETVIYQAQTDVRQN